MLLLGLNETINQMAMTNIAHWYGHVLMREDGYALRRALDFQVEGQMKNERLNRTWKKQVEEESVKDGFRMEDALRQSK